MLMIDWDFEIDAWSRFWRWNLINICVWTCDMNSTLGSVVPLAMFVFVFAFEFDVLYLSSNIISHHAPPCHLEPDLKAAVWVEPGVIGMSDCTRQARTPYGIHACIWNLNCKICIFVFVIWSWFLLAVQFVSEFHFILSYQLAPLLTLITALRAFELQQTSLWQKSDPDKVFCRELNRKQADSPT